MTPADNRETQHLSLIKTLTQPIAWRGLRAMTVGLVSAVVLAACSSNSTKPTVLPSLHSTTPNATPSAAPAATSAAAVTTAAPTPTGSMPAANPSNSTTPVTTATTKSPSTDDLAATSRQMEKAIRDYYAVTNRALRSPAALKEMRTLFGPGCGQCVSDASNYAKLQAQKWVIKGGTYRILSVKAFAKDLASGDATVTFNVLPATATDAKGRTVASEAAHIGRAENLSMVLVGSQWKILAYVSFGSTT